MARNYWWFISHAILEYIKYRLCIRSCPDIVRACTTGCMGTCTWLTADHKIAISHISSCPVSLLLYILKYTSSYFVVVAIANILSCYNVVIVAASRAADFINAFISVYNVSVPAPQSARAQSVRQCQSVCTVSRHVVPHTCRSFLLHSWSVSTLYVIVRGLEHVHHL
ncbi:hypothetical protein J6590_055040 [Homalodisca vitripennis]|nr:hypothetical protein J6590_055040 [Homalodisca vitripennis]